MESIIAIKELCEALGVKYDRSKSSAYYLHMVKEYRLHYIAAQQSVQPTICPACLGGKMYSGYGVEKPCDVCHKYGQ